MVAMMAVIIFFNIFYANNQSMNEEINQRTEEEFEKNFSDVGVKKVYYPDNADTKKATTYSTQVVDCKVKDVNLSDKRGEKHMKYFKQNNKNMKKNVKEVGKENQKKMKILEKYVYEMNKDVNKNYKK